MTILGILIIVIADLFMYRAIRAVKISSPGVGVYLQRSTVSFVLGLLFGFAMYKDRSSEVKESLRVSFEFLFMNLFLPFILIESALTANQKVQRRLTQKNFFSHFRVTCTYAIVGIVVSTLLVGLSFALISRFGWFGAEVAWGQPGSLNDRLLHILEHQLGD